MKCKTRGFIGPIGDDLPSIVMIVLSLTMFFSAVIFSFNAYIGKMDKLRLTQGAVELGRAVLSEGVVDLSDAGVQDRLRRLQQTYGLDAQVKIEPDSCGINYAYYLHYLVAAKPQAGQAVPELKKLFVCVK